MKASEVIAKFGGIRPMERTTGVPKGTIQNWKAKEFIPMEYHDELLRIAQENRIDLIRSDLDGAARKKVLNG